MGLGVLGAIFGAFFGLYLLVGVIRGDPDAEWVVRWVDATLTPEKLELVVWYGVPDGEFWRREYLFSEFEMSDRDFLGPRLISTEWRDAYQGLFCWQEARIGENLPECARGESD